MTDTGTGKRTTSARDSNSLLTLAWLPELQRRASLWVTKNFPSKEEIDAGLVAAEEAAEASAAMSRLLVKTRQGIRQDEGLDAKVRAEFADCLIAFSDYCTARGWSLAEVVEERANEVFARDWTSRSVRLEGASQSLKDRSVGG